MATPMRALRSFLIVLATAVVVGLSWQAAQQSSTPASQANRATIRPAALPASVVAGTGAKSASPAGPTDAVADPLGQFEAWTRRYQQADLQGRALLEAEGLQLALERRPVFKELIRTDPRRALARAVPRVVRQDLPAGVLALLEKPVSDKGTYNVYLGRPAPGVPVPPEGLVLRYFEAGGVSYKARVYGEFEQVLSRTNLPLRGVAVDRELAVAENAVRPLELGERIPPGVTVEQTCPVSGITSVAVSEGQVVTAIQPTVEIAGRLITLCDGGHVRVLEDEFRAFIQGAGAGGAGFFIDNFPGTSSRAIGNLRCLYIRVTYPDQMAQPNTEEQAFADMRDNARYYLENSYGKMTQTHTVTPVLMLPRTVAWYKARDAEVDGLGLVHTDARAAARAAGYDPGHYDCIIVRVNQGPRLEGISWGGGTSVWITWNGMDVLNHEIGHSLGLNHANSWTSLDGTPWGHGENAEYGNPFDVMGGGGGFGAHYNTLSKRQLGWLPDSYVHLNPGNGIYRIHAYDQPTQEEGRRYLLRVDKDNVRQYHIEYHPAAGGQQADGALVLYGGMGSNAGHLLDTTQGTAAGKNDGGIALGRTYSDTEADLHFTVLAKNDTVPPSLDVAFQRGPFPGNRSPEAELTASATTVAVNGSVTFTATASDADGDTLAYHWQFDDGVIGANTPVFSRSFTQAAQVTAMLTVSDMKGGSVRRSVVINAGSHGRQSVTGTITAAGLPVAGVLVTSGSKFCYSNSDGTYALAGLATGAQTLSASLAGYVFTPAFSNPLTVVSGANTADWTAAEPVRVTLAAVADPQEGGAAGTFRITRTGSIDQALSVLVTPASGSATKGTDYTFTPDYASSGSFRAFTVPAGAESLDVTVAAVNSSGVQDTTAEGPETVVLSLAGAPGYLSGTSGPVTLTIGDNDTSLPQVRVQAVDAAAAEGPDANTASLLFSRTGPTDQPLNLAVTWSGSAGNGTDFAAQATTVVIPAGQGSATVAIEPLDDVLQEGPETLGVTLDAQSTYVRAAANSASVMITDDDLPYVTVSAPDLSASEAGTDTGIFLISRTGPTTSPLKVYYGVCGSALHGTDYVALNGEVILPAGASSAPVVIQPYDDEIADPNETVTLALATFNNLYSLGAAHQATITLAENTDVPLVNVSAGTVGVEGGANATFVVRSIGSGSGTVTVRYSVAGIALGGSDYTPLTGTVNVPVNGSNDTTVTVMVLDDTMAEPTETVLVTLLTDPAYRIHNDGTAELAIRDNDSGSDRVSVSVNQQSPAEAAAAPGSFYLARTLSAGDLTVQYSVTGTATNGVDYALLSGTAVIPDNATGVDVVLTPVDDALLEGTETVTLTVLPATGYSPDRPASATFEVTDNDVPVVGVGFQDALLAVSEQPRALGEYLDLPVQLSAASPVPVTVRYLAGGGSASGDDVDWAFVDAANGNRPLAGGTLTFLPGMTRQNIRLRIRNDGLAEPTESAVLRLLSPFNASLTRGRGQLALTLFDREVPPLALEERWNGTAIYTNNTWNASVPDATSHLAGFTPPQDVGDAYSRRISGQIVPATTGVYTFWIASDDGSRLFLSTNSSATQKAQIAGLSGWTSFQNWDANASQKSANVTLMAGASYYLEVQHQEGGGGDHVSVAWQGPGFSRTPIAFSTADTAPRYVRLMVPGSVRAETEGSEPLLQVVLDRPAGATPVTVDCTATGTATAGLDYTLAAGTLTFAPGEQIKAVPLSFTDDSLADGPETVMVHLSNPTGAELAAPATHFLTLVDPDLPVVPAHFASAASSQAVGTLIATLTATPASGRSITGWSLVSGNGAGTFALDASGRLTLSLPAALPNPGGVQLVVRATDSAGYSAEGAVNVICNAGANAVVEQRWSGTAAYTGQNWSGTPAFTGTRATLTSAQNVADSYSRRLLGYLRPQVSGDYTFWIASDDDSRLFLSRDGYESGKVQIAAVNGWTGYQAWDQQGSQKSTVIPLTAGQVYWIEAQQMEGSGGDHVSVAWQGPGMARAAIPASAMLPTVAGIAFTAPAIGPGNAAPTISDLPDLAIAEEGSTGELNFTVSDAETPAGSLIVRVASSNALLLPPGATVVGGSGANRILALTPAANLAGSALVTLTVSDGLRSSSESFTLTVTGQPDAPSLSPLISQVLAVGATGPAQALTLRDEDTPLSDLTLTPSSSNPGLVPVEQIQIAGSGLERTITVTSAPDQVGSSTITLSLSDGTTTATSSFVVTVTSTAAQAWRQQHFGSIALVGDSADDADPDRDGLANLLEYALGLIPTVPEAQTGRLQHGMAHVGDQRYLRLTVNKNPDATDLDYAVEVSGNLMDWTTVGTTTEIDTAATLQVRDNTPAAQGVRRFIRLRISRR